MKKLTLFTLLAFACSISVSAQSNLKTESISIFKNGSAFYVKSGKVKTEEGKYRMTENFPKALFGTYWFNSSMLKSVKSYQDSVEQSLVANSITEMLLANEGKKVTLQVNGASVSGKLLSVTKLENGTSNSKNSIILVETNSVTNTSKNWVSMKSEDVESISFDEKPNMKFSSKKVQSIIELDFSDSKTEQTLDMMYLQNGLGWLPNYLITMTADDKANLTLRAEVTNDSEDIVNTSVNFVVGVPNFRYANKLASLVDFLGSGSRNNGYTGLSSHLSNSISTQRVSYGASDAWEGGGFGDFDDEEVESGVEIATVEDLFYYTISGISLKKGGRAYYDILKTKVDIEHIYESNISSNGVNESSYQKTYSFTQDNSNTVFHSIKMKNEAKSPWTTGSAMVVRTDDGVVKPISQDLLAYTPVGGTAFVKLTEAPDVKVKHAEKETSRNSQAIKWRNYSYDLIQVEGQLKVKNHKEKAIKLSVKRQINGEVKKSDYKWEAEERVNLGGSVNKTTQVCWEMNLKAGEEKVITYTYQVYVR